MAIGTKLGRLALRTWVRPKDIKPQLAESDLPDMTYTPSSATTAGSLPLPRGYRGGLQTSRPNGQDITIAVGQARNDADAQNILVTSAITKQIDADWAEGSAAGGFPDTALNLTASESYHVFVLGKADSSGYDAGFDITTNASNLLGDAAVVSAGYTTARRVASVQMDSGPTNINDYIQVGNFFHLVTPLLTTFTVISASRDDRVLVGLPTEYRMYVNCNIHTADSTINFLYVSATDQADGNPSDSSSPLSMIRHGTSASDSGTFSVMSDTSAQIGIRGDADATTTKVSLNGWWDDLGQSE